VGKSTQFIATQYQLSGCDNLHLLYDLFFQRFCKMIGSQSYVVDKSHVYAGKYWLVKFDNEPGIYIPTYYLENCWHITHFSVPDLIEQNYAAFNTTFNTTFRSDNECHTIANYTWLENNLKIISPAMIRLMSDATYQIEI
jgi:hypothetical protein